MMGKHLTSIRKIKRLDRDIVAAYARQNGLAKADGKRRVTLTLTLTAAQRRCDPDAYWKSLCDALVHTALLLNDSPKWCVLELVQYDRGATQANNDHSGRPGMSRLSAGR